MYQLFNRSHKPTFGQASFERLNETRRDVKLSLQTLQQYYQRSALRLRNDHVLVQLMLNLTMNPSDTLWDVQAKLEAREIGVARAFGMASPGGYGKAKERCLYSSSKNDVVEYLVALRWVEVNPFDDEDTSWREVPPLQVLTSPITSLSWDLPRGEGWDKETGVSMIGVDLVLLMLQYHTWRQDQYQEFEDDAVVNVNRFLVTDALPRMLASHIDAIFLNRLYQFSSKGVLESPQTAIEYSPISVINIAPSLNIVCRDVVRRLKNSKRPYLQYLETIPSFVGKNALAALQFPDIPKTRQSQWIILVSRWKAIQLLLTMGGKPAKTVNSEYLKQLKMDLQIFLNEKGYQEFHHNELERSFAIWAQTLCEEL